MSDTVPMVGRESGDRLVSPPHHLRHGTRERKPLSVGARDPPRSPVPWTSSPRGTRRPFPSGPKGVGPSAVVDLNESRSTS